MTRADKPKQALKGLPTRPRAAPCPECWVPYYEHMQGCSLRRKEKAARTAVAKLQVAPA